MTDYSVLMSVYNKEKPEYLRAAIDSMLKQSVPTNDFVLVCDGPLTDSLEEVIASFAKAVPGLFNVYRLPKNVGLAGALNHGILQCKNEIIARMDSDDISAPERMEKELKAMDEQQADIVGANVIEFFQTVADTGGIRKVPESPQDILRFAKKRSPFNHPSVVYRKSAVLRAGFYGDYRFFEDYHLWAVMLKQGCRGYNVQENLVYMRAGDGMYERRGGFSYIPCIVRFQRSLKQLGYINGLEFAVTVVSRSVVSIIPGKLRKAVYKKILRK